METRSSYVIVGTFVLFMLAALFAFVIYVAKIQLDEAVLPYHIFFSGSVTGLQEGSAVRYRGVAIGVVSDLRIAPEDASMVRVTIEVPTSTPITQDAVASIEMQGITGIAYIQIFGGAKGSPVIERTLGEIPVIPSKPSQISEVFDAAPQLLNRLIQLADRTALFMTPENARRVSNILANTESLSAEADSTLRNLNKISATAEEATKSFAEAAHQASLMMSENREPIRDFTTTGLYDSSLLISELREMVGHMSRLASQVERDPSGFLLAGPRNGVDPKDVPVPSAHEVAR